MQEQTVQELERRASVMEEADTIKRLEARSRVHREIALMKAEDKILELSSEEEDMLRSFRRFRLRMAKSAEVFTWQTHKPEGVCLVEDTALVVHPAEGSSGK